MNKSKRLKLDIPSSPIKTTPLNKFDTIGKSGQTLNDNLEQTNHTTLPYRKAIGVTAIVATVRSGPELRAKVQANKNKYSRLKTSSKTKSPKPRIIRILLDSGSNGDLLFHKKGAEKAFPYLIRQDPKVWSTLNGDFQTKGKGSLAVKFFDYSNSKEVFLTPDIVEYDGISNKPAFDLIIGAQTMTELGIILDFKEQMIPIDEIKLPMRSIDDLPSSNKEALSYQNCTRDDEPKATELATQRVVKILDVNYKKADLPELVKNNCTNLSSSEQDKLLEVLEELEDLFDGTLGV
jgi:hypothetical protein